LSKLVQIQTQHNSIALPKEFMAIIRGYYDRVNQVCSTINSENVDEVKSKLLNMLVSVLARLDYKKVYNITQTTRNHTFLSEPGIKYIANLFLKRLDLKFLASNPDMINFLTRYTVEFENIGSDALLQTGFDITALYPSELPGELIRCVNLMKKYPNLHQLFTEFSTIGSNRRRNADIAIDFSHVVDFLIDRKNGHSDIFKYMLECDFVNRERLSDLLSIGQSDQVSSGVDKLDSALTSQLIVESKCRKIINMIPKQTSNVVVTSLMAFEQLTGIGPENTIVMLLSLQNKDYFEGCNSFNDAVKYLLSDEEFWTSLRTLVFDAITKAIRTGKDIPIEIEDFLQMELGDDYDKINTIGIKELFKAHVTTLGYNIDDVTVDDVATEVSKVDEVDVDASKVVDMNAANVATDASKVSKVDEVATEASKVSEVDVDASNVVNVGAATIGLAEVLVRPEENHSDLPKSSGLDNLEKSLPPDIRLPFQYMCKRIGVWNSLLYLFSNVHKKVASQDYIKSLEENLPESLTAETKVDATNSEQSITTNSEQDIDESNGPKVIENQRHSIGL
jgi:hypothetical protein